ncbi:toll/interleukin-1 receptor domain-containing adapter protein-like [Epinephelus fuscoguttatus]|uniref:toll/interleukin-1 receptor domain-containing adapter protein-like n=1 Tax=Epinephelus fuscoguttatus TaxID=293821 RepID=UPI0020D04D09|nr:toll/interleukin-1 receptor domain-containing adapter protein-like [Epinephelus fuscoguttatus]XP_049433423.1 toll/interleukin-1 receptor domain-containing adapter protein-like [Epinephelus fuscoguttatus]
MHGWFQKLLKSRASVPAQCEQETKVAKKSVSSVSSASTSSPSTSTSSSLSSSPSLGTAPFKKTSQPQSALSSLLRWSRKYDVFVCHSSVHSDTEEAIRLVSFLEASPQSLRCFLWQRDTCPGGAMSTELCQAVEESHLRALLITPNFLQDDWCIYMMHQALAEGPMSNRLIPLVQNLSRSQYPQELRFFFYIDLSRNPDRGYTLVNKTVLKYLQDLAIKEKELECNTDSSDEPSGESSPKKDNLMLSNDPTETQIPLEVIEKRDKSLSDVCEHHQQ